MNIVERWDNNFKILMEQNDHARDNTKSLVGRVIKHPYADGYAFYQVVKETSKTCTIEVCTDIGDDWVLPAWGQRCSIPKTQVTKFLAHDEALRKLFSGVK